MRLILITRSKQNATKRRNPDMRISVKPINSPEYITELVAFADQYAIDAFELKDITEHLCCGFEYIGSAAGLPYFTLSKINPEFTRH
jgi:hypothetical protein